MPSTGVGDDERFSATVGAVAFFFVLDCFLDGESVMPSTAAGDDELFSETGDGEPVMPSTAVGDDELFSVTGGTARFFFDLDCFRDVAFTLSTSPGISDS